MSINVEFHSEFKDEPEVISTIDPGKMDGWYEHRMGIIIVARCYWDDSGGEVHFIRGREAKIGMRISEEDLNSSTLERTLLPWFRYETPAQRISGEPGLLTMQHLAYGPIKPIDALEI